MPDYKFSHSIERKRRDFQFAWNRQNTYPKCKARMARTYNIRTRVVLRSAWGEEGSGGSEPSIFFKKYQEQDQ